MSNPFTSVLERATGDKHVEVHFTGEKPSVENGFNGSLEIDFVTDFSGSPVECTAEEYQQLLAEAAKQIANR